MFQDNIHNDRKDSNAEKNVGETDTPFFPLHKRILIHWGKQSAEPLLHVGGGEACDSFQTSVV